MQSTAGYSKYPRNALVTRSYRGLETYYLGATTERRIERLAGAENQGSGYSLADFKRLLEGVYTHVRQKDSKQLAEHVHRGLATRLIKGDPAIKDSGIKPAPFLVLVATEMPGILAEISYVSNEEDARLLARGLASIPGVRIDPEKVQTNIVIFDISGAGTATAGLSAALKERGVLANGINTREMRMVTHKDVSSQDCLTVLEIIKEALS